MEENLVIVSVPVGTIKALVRVVNFFHLHRYGGGLVVRPIDGGSEELEGDLTRLMAWVQSDLGELIED